MIVGNLPCRVDHCDRCVLDECGVPGQTCMLYLMDKTVSFSLLDLSLTCLNLFDNFMQYNQDGIKQSFCHK